MKNELTVVLRARALRATLAQNEVTRQRQSLARAEAAVEAARQRKAAHEEQAAQAGAMLFGSGNGAEPLLAGEMHRLLDFAAGARFKAAECVALVRRADLARARVQEDCDAAREESRRHALRHASVATTVARTQGIEQRRRLEREGESAAEDHTTRVSALRVSGGADAGHGGSHD